jgi:hypothetical protein
MSVVFLCLAVGWPATFPGWPEFVNLLVSLGTVALFAAWVSAPVRRRGQLLRETP